MQFWCTGAYGFTEDIYLEYYYQKFSMLILGVYWYVIIMYLSLLTDKLLVPMDPGIFFFINQGTLTVDNMDDPEEMKLVDVCRHVLLLFTNVK
jgi:hypothetical protein